MILAHEWQKSPSEIDGWSNDDFLTGLSFLELKQEAEKEAMKKAKRGGK